MCIDWTITGDGIATVIAGVFAFVAVIFQIRSSSLQLKTQLDTERDARIEDQERQKRALAAAILCEIDEFYWHHIRDARCHLENVNPETEINLPSVKKIPEVSFAVYQGCVGRLGQLPPSLLVEIVHFYNNAASFVATTEAYQLNLERKQQGHNPLLEDALARTRLKQIKERLPQFVLLAKSVCRDLSAMTDLKFEELGIAVEERTPTAPTEASPEAAGNRADARRNGSEFN